MFAGVFAAAIAALATVAPVAGPACTAPGTLADSSRVFTAAPPPPACFLGCPAAASVLALLGRGTTRRLVERCFPSHGPSAATRTGGRCAAGAAGAM
jgi:hypothetical protein